MKRDVLQLEQLPNEILIEMFQYFDARDLFDCFYNLNTRFNTLMKAFSHLNLTFHVQSCNDNDTDKNSLFSPYVHTLFVGRAIDIDLHKFSNIRNVKLECPLRRVLAQLNFNTLPHLTHVDISHLDVIATVDEWTTLPSLRTLKVSCISLLAYQTILATSPNLVSFQFSIYSSDHSSLDIEPHTNLKRLIIDVLDITLPWNDQVFHRCLSCVPNIEKLDVYRTMYISRIDESLLEYDWLASTIESHLSAIRQFNFYFQIIQSRSFIEPNIETVLRQIENIFQNNHHNQCRSRHILYI